MNDIYTTEEINIIFFLQSICLLPLSLIPFNLPMYFIVHAVIYYYIQVVTIAIVNDVIYLLVYRIIHSIDTDTKIKYYPFALTI